MSLLLRFVSPTPPATLSEPLSYYPADPARRRPPVSSLGSAAALVLAPLLALQAASFPDVTPRRAAQRDFRSEGALVLAPILLAPPSAGEISASRRTAQQGGAALVSDAVAPAAAFDLVTVLFPDAARRARAPQQGAAALLFDAVRDAPPPVQGQERARARSESRSQPLLPDLTRDAPPPVQGQERARARSDSRSQPLLPDAIAPPVLPVLVDTAGENEHHRQRAYDQATETTPPLPQAAAAPPPVFGQERVRFRSESRSLPFLPDLARDAPPPVQGQAKARARSESRSVPLLPDAIAPPVLPVLVDTAGENEHHRQRQYDQARETTPPQNALLAPPLVARSADPGKRRSAESRSLPLLPDALAVLPLPVLVDTAGENESHRQRQFDQAREVTFILDQLAGLPPSVESPQLGARPELGPSSVAAAPALAPPAPIPSGGHGVREKKKIWIQVAHKRVLPDGQVELTYSIEDLLNPEVSRHPMFSAIIDEAPPIGIHETAELRELRKKLAAEEARAKELEAAGGKAERSARRWRFGAVGLAIVLALLRARRR